MLSTNDRAVYQVGHRPTQPLREYTICKKTSQYLLSFLHLFLIFTLYVLSFLLSVYLFIICLAFSISHVSVLIVLSNNNSNNAPTWQYLSLEDSALKIFIISLQCSTVDTLLGGEYITKMVGCHRFRRLCYTLPTDGSIFTSKMLLESPD
jgi:hypothetical protein